MLAVEVNGLHKRFRIPNVRRATVREHLFGLFRPRKFDNLDVLRGVSFTIQKGEAVGIMGRNGSGKSTLLKIMAGIYRPDSGRVVTHAPVTPILNLGLGWNGELTARDNLELTGTAMGLSLKEVREQFDEIVAFAELERFIDLPVKFYSSGMNARLAYSIAFRAVRDVLLLDEVFAVGDADFTRRCEQKFTALHQAGHTMILVSHNQDDITKFCQRAILIEGGRVAADGDAVKVAAEYKRIVCNSEGAARQDAA